MLDLKESKDSLKKQLKDKRALVNFIKIGIKGNIVLEVVALIICLMIGGLQTLSLWMCYTIVTSIASIYAKRVKNNTLKDIRKLNNKIKEIEEKELKKELSNSKNIDLIKENMYMPEPRKNIENDVTLEVNRVKEEPSPRLVKRKQN